MDSNIGDCHEVCFPPAGYQSESVTIGDSKSDQLNQPTG